MIGTKCERKGHDWTDDLNGSGRGEAKAASIGRKNRDRGEALDDRIEDIEASRQAGRQGEDGHGIDAGITVARQEADVAAGNNKTSGDDDSGRTGSDRGGDDDWESRDLTTIGGFLVGRR